MAVTKLTCPECESVLRPAKPLAAGKRVKCPSCGTLFTAREEEAESPKTAAGKKGATAKKEEEKPKQSGLQFETSTYAFVKEGEEAAKATEEEKAERGERLMEEFLKINKSKDPRGPAQELVTRPSNYLILTGSLGAIAYGLLLVLFIVVYLMPPPKVEDLDEEGTKKRRLKGLQIGPALSGVAYGQDPQKQELDELAKQKAEEVALFAYMTQIQTTAVYWFIGICFLYLIGIVYCALIIYGAVKVQNLVERPWGFVSSIMAMVPVGALGFMVLTIPPVFILFGLLYSDPLVVWIFTIVVIVIELLWGLGIGIWLMKTLAEPMVIEAYEYVEDQDEKEEEDEEAEEGADEDDEED